MRKFFLRYGVFTVIALMLVGMLLLLNTFSFRQKTPATLVAGGTQLVAYVGRCEGFVPAPGDTFLLEQTAAGSLVFVIDSIREEPLASVLLLHTPDGAPLLSEQLDGNTRLTGYVFTGTAHLYSLVFKGR